MELTVFRILVFVTLVATVASVVVFELSRTAMPSAFKLAKKTRDDELDEYARAHPWFPWLARIVIFGSALALAAMIALVPFSNYLFFSLALGWTWLSWFTAPLVIPKRAVPFYETALMLSGAVIVLSCFTPLVKAFHA